SSDLDLFECVLGACNSLALLLAPLVQRILVARNLAQELPCLFAGADKPEHSGNFHAPAAPRLARAILHHERAVTVLRHQQPKTRQVRIPVDRPLGALLHRRSLTERRGEFGPHGKALLLTEHLPGSSRVEWSKG